MCLWNFDQYDPVCPQYVTAADWRICRSEPIHSRLCKGCSHFIIQYLGWWMMVPDVFSVKQTYFWMGSEQQTSNEFVSGTAISLCGRLGATARRVAGRWPGGLWRVGPAVFFNMAFGLMCSIYSICVQRERCIRMLVADGCMEFLYSAGTVVGINHPLGTYLPGGLMNPNLTVFRSKWVAFLLGFRWSFQGRRVEKN